MGLMENGATQYLYLIDVALFPFVIFLLFLLSGDGRFNGGFSGHCVSFFECVIVGGMVVGEKRWPWDWRGPTVGR